MIVEALLNPVLIVGYVSCSNVNSQNLGEWIVLSYVWVSLTQEQWTGLLLSVLRFAWLSLGNILSPHSLHNGMSYLEA